MSATPHNQSRDSSTSRQVFASQMGTGTEVQRTLSPENPDVQADDASQNPDLDHASISNGLNGLSSERRVSTVSQSSLLPSILAAGHSAISLSSRPPSRAGDSSPEDIVPGPSDFELLRRRTLAQQPHRGMVSIIRHCEDQIVNDLQSPHVKQRWKKFISAIQTQNMVTSTCRSSSKSMNYTLLIEVTN